MRIKQHLLFLIFTSFFCQTSLANFSETYLSLNDTIPEVTPSYKGNRIMIKSIKVIKKRGNSVKFQYKLVNTGKNKIKLGKGRNIPSDLIVTFDKSLEANDLLLAKEAIIESIKKQKISIRPGQLIMSNKMKVSYSPLPPTDRIAEKDNDESTDSTTSKILIDEQIVENEKSEIEETKIINSEVSETKEPTIEKLGETILTKESDLEKPTIEIEHKELPSIKEDSIVQIAIIEKDSIFDSNTIIENEETVVKTVQEELVSENVKEVMTTENLQEETTTETVQQVATIKTTNDEIVIEKPQEEILVESSQEKIIEAELAELAELTQGDSTNLSDEKIAVTLENEIEEIATDSLSKTILNKNLCGDLVLQDVEIVKKNRRYVIVKYTVTNVGNFPIALLGESKKLEDNIALQAHFTRSNKLTRGSIPVKLAFIKKGLKDKKGLLKPAESYTSKLKIETSKMTKFTPVLALSLNPFNITMECSKLNNTIFLNIADQDAPPPSDPLPIKPKLELEEGEEVIGSRN